MRKYLKIIVPAVCVIVVAITFYMIFDIQNKVEEKNFGTENIAVNEENVVDENETNVENVVDNTVNTNSIQEENKVEDEDVVPEEEDKLSTTKLDNAIDIVKDYWGEDDSVYFTNEGVDSDGKYTVAVRQKTSTTVKNYFKVDLKTKKVEIYY